MRGQVQDTRVREKSLCVYVCVCLHVCVFEWLQMCGGWLFHGSCEKLDLVELCQPGGQKSVMFAGLYSNQALCREIRKKWFMREKKRGGKKREKDFVVHPEFECMWGGG